MPTLAAIPLKTGVTLVEVSENQLREIGQIHFNEPAKSVVCENGTVVSLVKRAEECILYIHKMEEGIFRLISENLISDEVRYSHIAVRGNVVYLGALYLPNIPFDPLLCVDCSGSRIVVKAEKQYRRFSECNILNMCVEGEYLYVYENRYPMGVVVFDVSDPFEPKQLLMRELEISTRLQFVKNFTVTPGWMAIVANYNDNLSLTNYLHIYGPNSVTLKSYFQEIYRNDPKYIEMRRDMGLLPESVGLSEGYSWSYSLRRMLSFPFKALLSAIVKRSSQKKRMFDIKILSYPTERMVDVVEPVRIVDILFSGNLLFLIANGKVGYIDIAALEHPVINFVNHKVEEPVKLISTGIPGAVIVRGYSDYELVTIGIGSEVESRFERVSENINVPI